MAEKFCEEKKLASAVAHLDLAVLVRQPSAERFQLAGTAPSWFASTFGGEEHFPKPSLFLTAFIEGAALDCWQGELSHLKSGYWEETDEQGQSHFYEATAYQDGEQDMLLIAFSDEAHKHEQRYLQHAHDVALHQRRLAKEKERKEVLLNCIVHELSKPLSTILMNLQFVQAQLDRKDLIKALARAESQAEAQRALIHSISHTFDSELTDFEPTLLAQKEGVPLSSLIAEAITSLRHLTLQQQVTIQSEGTLPPSFVIAEKGHLARVLENLLERAIRRTTSQGSISITLQCQDGFIRTSISNQPTSQLENTSNNERADLSNHFCKMAIERWGGKLHHEQNCSWFELQEHPTETSAQDFRPHS